MSEAVADAPAGRGEREGGNPSDPPAQPSPRRSGRARVSTTVRIDGHAVLRQNNYAVTGCNYVYRADGSDATAAAAGNVGRQEAEKASQPPKKKKAKAHHPPNPAQVARQNHNRGVAAAAGPRAPLRWNFLARHRRRLEPFCEDAVVRKLEEVWRTTQRRERAETPGATIAAPKMVRATLRDYQLRGLGFMARMHEQNLGMILGDEMGLGKTLQTISLLCHLKEREGLTGPSLIICPLSVLSSWCRELQRWAPGLRYFRLHASNAGEQARQKQELADRATEYDVILTTYDMAKVPALLSLYHRLHFHYLVLDECQKIKGHATQLAAAVRRIHRGNALLLTGTPLQNNLVELWALLNFLYPDVFTTMAPFEEHFNLSANAANGNRIVVDKDFLVKTQRLLELFMLRRLKTEVEKLLPDKLETKVYCPLSKTQTFWYKGLLLKDATKLANMEDPAQALGATRHTLLRSLFMQLRKCCNHPFLFEGAEADASETTLTGLVAASGKLSVLDMLLQSLFEKGNRAVIFSQFTMMLDLLEDYCNMRGWKYCRFDGSTGRAERNYLIRRFNEPDSPYFLFIISTRSGGMGLNLQSADTCILFDSDWNPQSDIQAMARVHRIGQTKTVHVYRLVSSGTVEERMLERAEKKLLLEMVNRESKDTPSFEEEDTARGLSARELLDDIKFGCEAVFGNTGNNELPSREEIDYITDRSRKESDSAGKLKGGASKSAISYDAEKEFSATQVFGGANFREIRRQQELKQKRETPKNLAGIARLWSEIQQLDEKRARKSRIIQVAGAGSGYGAATVPVLASNNYELLNGESSVFDRELSNSSKDRFQVKKQKKNVQEYDHQDFCQVCGDGGDLVCCPRCPCCVHLGCVGLSKSTQFWACPHHRCSTCGKNRESSGGLLFPCESCANAYCEDCLPKNARFLDRVDRFEKLGFHATKNVVYIHCSPTCENVARVEFGYVAPQPQKRLSKEPLDLTYNFGSSISEDLKKAQEELKDVNQEDNAISNFMRTRRGKSVAGTEKWQQKRITEKLCPISGDVLGVFDSIAAAARSIPSATPSNAGSLAAMLNAHLRDKPNLPFKGCMFRIKEAVPLEKLCPTSGAVLESFMTSHHAARSVNSYDKELDQHMKSRPDEPFCGFVFRFKHQSPRSVARVTGGFDAASEHDNPIGWI